MTKEGKENRMTTREAVLSYGLSLPDTYQDATFHDENWQLMRFRKNKKMLDLRPGRSLILSVVTKNVWQSIAKQNRQGGSNVHN